MSSLYACDKRLREKLSQQEPTPGYCIFIDVVDSVALKDKGFDVWCEAMYVIWSALRWLEVADSTREMNKRDFTSLMAKPCGLPPLKVIGDCIMFYIPKLSMPRRVDALTLFDSLLNIIRVPKQAGPSERSQVRAVITCCRKAMPVAFVEGTADIQGKEIDLAARLVEQADPQELLMDEEFHREAMCVFLNYKAAGNVRRRDDGYEQFASVEGPWTRNIRGFREPIRMYKWRNRQ